MCWFVFVGGYFGGSPQEAAANPFPEDVVNAGPAFDPYATSSAG
jgi:hypothetical protein